MNLLNVRPEFSTVSPYLIFRDAAKALAFYTSVMGAEEISCQRDDQGNVRHAEFRIGNSTFMMTSETPDFPDMRGVETVGGSPVHLFIYMSEVDAYFARVVAAGASITMPVAEQSYGRGGGFRDPFGLTWWVSTHRDRATSDGDNKAAHRGN